MSQEACEASDASRCAFDLCMQSLRPLNKEATASDTQGSGISDGKTHDP